MQTDDVSGKGCHPLGVDRMVHEPARLIILWLLSMIDSADFMFIMNQTGLSWGNLSAHMSKLEKAGYIDVIKSFKDNRPHTVLRLTMQGRFAVRNYRKQMKPIIDALPDQ